MSAHITTASGGEVCLHRPDVKTLLAADIAHHLACINRFTGAARRPYSVAEHSLLVLEIVQRLFAGEADVHGHMAALMHDAHEAYTNDLSTPAKGEVSGWHEFEGRLERTVRSAWGLHTAHYKHRDIIHGADLIALATERAQLLPNPPGASLWPCLVHVQPVTWVDLMSPEREAMTWRDWRQQFADTMDALDYARTEALRPLPSPIASTQP